MMIKLIWNEFVKIFSKKSIFILWGFMFGFCILNNVLYKIDYDQDGNYKYEETENVLEEIQQITQDLKQYDKDNKNQVSMYVTLKTKLDLCQIKKEFLNNSWQYYKVEDYLYEYVYQKNFYTYQEQDELLLKEASSLLKEQYKYLKEGNWQYFFDRELSELKEQNLFIQENLRLTKDEEKRLEYLKQQQELEDKIEILEYRIKEQILEDNSYLNEALRKYQESMQSIRYYENLQSKKTAQEDYQYQEALSTNKINQYIIEKKQNINQENNLNYQLRTIVDDYELFFVILILILVSIVICDEFHNGTIKLLLIKPHSRCKILISKYFTSVIVIMISIILLIGFQIAIGSVIFGIDSLKIPVISYCYNTGNLLEYSVFKYMFIRILAKMPFLLIFLLIGINIGVIVANTAVTLMIPLILYLFAPTIQTLAVEHNLKWLKYLISMNWNFQDYLFGKSAIYPYINFKFSCFVWLSYFVVIIILTLICFKKKNIKNI